MKTSFKKILWLLLYVYILIFFSILIERLEVTNYRLIGFFIVFNFGLNLISFKLFKINFFSPIVFFILFLYLFNFGQIILIGFVVNYNFELTNILEKVGIESLFGAVVYAIKIISLLVVGILISSLFYKPAKSKVKNLDQIYYKYCKPMAVLLLGLSVPAMIVIDLIKLRASIAGGYHSIYDIYIPGFLSFISNLFLPGILFLLIYNKDNKNKTRVIVAVCILYKIFSMLSGSRAVSFIFIVVLLYVYLKLIEKVTLHKLVGLSIGSFLLLYILFVIRNIRTHGIKSIYGLMNSFIDLSSTNIIFNTFEEFGGTLYTTSLVLVNYPTKFDFLYGSGYFVPLLTVLPNLFGLNTDVVYKFLWAQQLSEVYPHIGGSFIAELYVNFGVFSYLLAFFFGVIFLKLSRLYEKQINQNNYLFVCAFAMTLSYSFLWVRETAAGMVRPTIWSLIIIYGLYFLLKKLSCNKS